MGCDEVSNLSAYWKRMGKKAKLFLPDVYIYALPDYKKRHLRKSLNFYMVDFIRLLSVFLRF